MFKERWILTISTPKGTANLAVSRELGEVMKSWIGVSANRKRS